MALLGLLLLAEGGWGGGEMALLGLLWVVVGEVIVGGMVLLGLLLLIVDGVVVGGKNEGLVALGEEKVGSICCGEVTGAKLGSVLGLLGM